MCNTLFSSLFVMVYIPEILISVEKNPFMEKKHDSLLKHKHI